MITTTLKQIRKAGPCGLRPENNGSLTGYLKLKAFLGDEWDDDAPIKFSQIAESNGINDALWCLRTVCPEHEKEVRLFAADCAEQVLHIYEARYPSDNRPRLAIEAARAFANGEITEGQLAAAWATAWAAARAAARATAGAAAWATAGAAAWAAAWATAWATAGAAAWATAGAAAWAAARAAARATAGAAAWDAAWAAQLKMMTDRFS